MTVKCVRYANAAMPFPSGQADWKMIERWLLDKALLLQGLGFDDLVEPDRLWRKGKQLLLSDAALAFEFAVDYICGRFPEGEKAIARCPYHAYRYAKDVLKGRFLQAEKAIARDPNWATSYASDVIKGRFPEAEKVISECKDSALRYACHAVGGRFAEAEKLFAADAMTAYAYATLALKSRFVAAEQLIAKEGHSGYSKWYCECFSRSFDENAAALCPYWAYRYAKNVVEGKLPPKLHQKMQMWAMSEEHKGDKYIEQYLNSMKYQ